MAVEGLSRVAQGVAGTGEAFMLGESKALGTYVKQEGEQIAAKQKADKDVTDWQLPDVGWAFEETVQKEFDAYQDELLRYQNEGLNLQDPELRRKQQRIKDMARQSVNYTKRIDEINKSDPKAIFGEENAKYFDKALLVKDMTRKLQDEDGRIMSPDKVNASDLEDVYSDNAFLTNVFMDDFVKNIDKQMSIEGNTLSTRGFGQYITKEGNKVRFVNGVNEDGTPKAGVNDSVAQLALDNPTYRTVIEKKAEREIIQPTIQKLMEDGLSEQEAKDLVLSKKDDFLLEYAKDDINAYQQIEKTSEMKLGLNVGTTQAALISARANQQRANTADRAEKRAQAKQDNEIEATATSKASIVATKIQSANGKTANLGAFGSIAIPNDKIAKKDGENGVKEGEAIPRSFSLNSVFNISSGGASTKGTVLRVQGKESQAGTFSPVEGDYGQKQYQPQSIKKILVNKEGELVDIAGIGNKTDAELAQVARENGLQLLEAAEMKDMETGDLILTPMEGNPERQNIYNYFNTNYEKANQSLGEVEGVSRYEKLDAQGTKDRKLQPKESKNFTWGSSSNNQNTNIQTDGNGLAE